MLKADGSCTDFTVAAAQEPKWKGGSWGKEHEGRETQKNNQSEEGKEFLLPVSGRSEASTHISSAPFRNILTLLCDLYCRRESWSLLCDGGEMHFFLTVNQPSHDLFYHQYLTSKKWKTLKHGMSLIHVNYLRTALGTKKGLLRRKEARTKLSYHISM